MFVMEMLSSTRQLAAIMFTDIVGYTALMGSDESQAMDLLRRNKDIQKPLVEKYGGTWLKEMGDGTMSSFTTASNAINCALDIQKELHEDADLNLRIGIHLGEIILEEGDIYGDGVNIASRLESIADPGGIYISDSVQKAIRGNKDIQYVLLGELELKNVDYPVKTYALRAEFLPRPKKTEEKHLSGRLIAELRRRNVPRAGLAYLAVVFIVYSILQYITLDPTMLKIIYGILALGIPVSIYLAWNYERSPNGFVRISSRKAWFNPYSEHQKKPFTSNVVIIFLLVIIVGLIVFPRVKGDQMNSEIVDKSIAVLAFDDMSQEGDQEYFCDGISEEIINNLAQIKELKVIGRSSSFQFKGKNPDHREVGEKLGVSSFLEGSIRKSGNKIRVTAQLISVEDGSHIWSETYDRNLDDIFQIQDEISQSIAEQMKVSMGLTKSNPVDLEVYDLYLRARTLLQQRGTGVELSIKLFEQIIEQDSTFQPAWTGLAQAWIVLPVYLEDDSLRTNPTRAWNNTERAVQKALLLNPDDAEALATKATLLKEQGLFSEAYENYEKAMAINDHSPVILEDYVQFLLTMGYAQKSMPFAQNMIDLDPLTPQYLQVYSFALMVNGRNQEGLNALKKAIRINPNISIIYRSLTWAYLNDNQIDSALNVLNTYRWPSDVFSDYKLQIEAVRQGSPSFDFNLKHSLFFAMNELNQMEDFFNVITGEYLTLLSPVYAPQGLTLHSERFLSDPRMKEIIRIGGFIEFWEKYGWPDRCRPVGDEDFVCE